MAVPLKPISPALLAEGRRLYEHTRVPVDDIAALLGISPRTLHSRIRKWKWQRRQLRIPQDEPEQSSGQAARPDETEDSASQDEPQDSQDEPQDLQDDALLEIDLDEAVTIRVMRAVERQLAAVERIAARLNPQPEHAEEAERAARVLVSLSRTLAALKDVRAAAAAPEVEDDDTVPRDLDELRRVLSQRLDRIVSGAAGDLLREPPKQN